MGGMAGDIYDDMQDVEAYRGDPTDPDAEPVEDILTDEHENRGPLQMGLAQVPLPLVAAGLILLLLVVQYGRGN